MNSLNNESALEEAPAWRGHSQVQPLGAQSHDPELQLRIKPSLDHSGQNPSVVSEHPSEKTKPLRGFGFALHTALVFLTVSLLYTVQGFLAESSFQNTTLCEKKQEDHFHPDTNTSCNSVFTLP